MRVNVVTTWEPGFPGAARFMASFQRHWPDWATLHLFHESAPLDADSAQGFDPTRIVLHDLDADTERAAFLAAAPEDGRDYRQNARKFCHKVFAYTAPAVRDCDLLIWMDADTETKAPITLDWLRDVGPFGLGYSYLGRRDYEHSECGWLAFAMPEAAPMLDAIRRLYTTRRLLILRGKTDCHAFDIARRAAGCEGRNLSAGAKGLHVWPQTRLAERLDHHKGPARKAAAYGSMSAA